MHIVPALKLPTLLVAQRVLDDSIWDSPRHAVLPAAEACRRRRAAEPWTRLCWEGWRKLVETPTIRSGPSSVSLAGVPAGTVVWALIGAAVMAAYQLTPSWVSATVQRLLLAAG